MYIYSTDGEPVGFRFANFIHDMDGTPLGRILGTHVHTFDGGYIGELFKEMVVAKPSPHARPILPIDPPAAVPSPGMGTRRRGIVDYGFADRFALLRGAARDPLILDDPMALAAE